MPEDVSEEHLQITAEKHYSRAGKSNPHRHTLDFIQRLVEIQCELTDLESDLACLDMPAVPYQWQEFENIKETYRGKMEEVNSLEKAVVSPGTQLNDILPDDADPAEAKATSQVQTIVMLDPFPKLLSRLFATHDRVGQKIAARRQERQTRLIALFSGAAVLLSLVSIVITVIL